MQLQSLSYVAGFTFGTDLLIYPFPVIPRRSDVFAEEELCHQQMLATTSERQAVDDYAHFEHAPLTLYMHRATKHP